MSKKPAKAAPLSDKRRRFVAEYLKDLNATQAAIRAGYSPRTANRQGSRLLSDADILAAVTDAKAKRAEAVEVDAEQVLRELCLLGFSDMGTFLRLGEDGQARLDWSDLPQGATRAIQEITQEEFMDGSGDDARPVRRTKFKLYSKQAALDSIAKHLGMFVERHEHSGKLTVLERVREEDAFIKEHGDKIGAVAEQIVRDIDAQARQ